MIHELEDGRMKIFLLRNQQSKEIVYQGEVYSLLELGKKLAKEDEQVFHFPGKEGSELAWRNHLV